MFIAASIRLPSNAFPSAPPLSESEHHYQHAYLQFDVVVVGGGPHGIEAALASAEGGMRVALLEKQPGLGGDSVLVEEVLAHPMITTFVNCTCFGLYEGNLLGAVQIDYDRPNAETLLHLRAGGVVVATGAYETQFLFANNDLPGVMLSTAVLRLLHQYKIVPGKRAVLIGDTARCSELQPTSRPQGSKWWRVCPSARSSAPWETIMFAEWQPKQLPMTRIW